MRIKRVIAVAAAVLMSAAVLWQMYLRGFFLPSWVEWKEVSLTGDFDLDGKEETLQTENKQILMDGNILLPKEWLISDLQSGDIDRDGRQEIILLVFNRQNFGRYRPVWEGKDQEKFYEHIYIYHYENGKLVPFWMSSQLKPELTSVLVRDDGMIEASDTMGEKSLWQWITWGLERADK